MHIIFNTYPVAFETPGGGEIQLLKTRSALQELGHEVSLHDVWKPRLREADVVQFFSVQGGVENFHHYIKSQGIPFAIAPILWPGRDLTAYPLDEIRWMLNTADVILPNSRMEAERLSEVFRIPLEKFHPVPNGVDRIFCEDTSSTGELFRRTFQVDEPFSLCLGNIEPRKNQLMLANCARETRSLVIAAGHARDPQYLQAAEVAGAGYFRYVGPLEHASELHRSAYRACRTFLLPSLLETPGLAALEAAAMGCRLVVTQEGCAREYFGDHASYCDPESSDSIIDAWHASLSGPEKSPTLRDRITSNYLWKHAALATIKAYEHLLYQHRQSRARE